MQLAGIGHIKIFGTFNARGISIFSSNVWSVYAPDSGNQPQIGHQPRHSSREGISFGLLKDLEFIPCLLQNHVAILILNPLKSIIEWLSTQHASYSRSYEEGEIEISQHPTQSSSLVVITINHGSISHSWCVQKKLIGLLLYLALNGGGHAQ